MFQEVTAATGASHWAIASLLFFFTVFVGLAVRLFRAPKAPYDAMAQLPLADDITLTATDGCATPATPSGREN